MVGHLVEGHSMDRILYISLEEGIHQSCFISTAALPMPLTSSQPSNSHLELLRLYNQLEGPFSFKSSSSPSTTSKTPTNIKTRGSHVKLCPLFHHRIVPHIR